MIHRDRVFHFIQTAGPDGVTNTQICEGTGISPHQAAFRITQELFRQGRIRGERLGSVWHFYGLPPDEEVQSPGPVLHANASATRFEEMARKIIGEKLSTPLAARTVPGVPKIFDLVSEDGSIVGDAKYYTLVNGLSTPPAKFSVIAEHVWLLEQTHATTQFLVFGNDRRVPENWLKKYGHLVREVVFYFMDDSGHIESLN